MSEMIERVARGLAAHSWELIGNDHAKEPFIDRRWPHYVGQARAAIEAMRVPNDALLEQGPPEPYMDDQVWGKMIDAALGR